MRSRVMLAMIVLMKTFDYRLPYHAMYISIVACFFFAWLTDRSLRGVKGSLAALLQLPWLAVAGRASYSAFLTHNFTDLLIPPIPGVAEIVDSNLKFVILIPMTFALAHLMVKYIEEPFGHFRKARFRMPTNAPLRTPSGPRTELPAA